MSERADKSAHVKRARNELRAQLAKDDRKMTPEALEHALKSIHQWIANQGSARERFEEKTFALFDENRHPAPTVSKFIKQLRQDLHGVFSKVRDEEEAEPESLEGRISGPDEGEPSSQ